MSDPAENPEEVGEEQPQEPQEIEEPDVDQDDMYPPVEW